MFFIMREVKYWKESSDTCRDLHPLRQSMPLPRDWHIFGSLKMLVTNRASTPQAFGCPTCPPLHGQAQQTELCKHAAGLKAKKSHLHREHKGQAVVCRSSPEEKKTPNFFTFFKFTDLVKPTTAGSDSPLPQAEPLGALTAQPHDHGASL